MNYLKSKKKFYKKYPTIFKSTCWKGRFVSPCNEYARVVIQMFYCVSHGARVSGIIDNKNVKDNNNNN